MLGATYSRLRGRHLFRPEVSGGASFKLPQEPIFSHCFFDEWWWMMLRPDFLG